MKTKTGWTCTCRLNRLGVPLDSLCERKEDVLCYDEYWNHDEGGKPVKVKVTRHWGKITVEEI